MSGLYVLGARQRSLLVKSEEEWNLYESALILQLDTESGRVVTCVEYKSPLEARANENSSNVFKAGTIVGDTLYACTSTEVLILKLPEFKKTGYISLPCFNDIHHVTPSSDGNLLVANTGLDMVVKFTAEGKILATWDVLDEPLWSRFSQDVDYRKVESTKPHKSHPNFVFELDGKVWVTRFRQRDAICLEDRSKRIDVAVMTPHDGLVWGDHVYFTTVDGRIVIADSRTFQIGYVADLKEIDGSNALLGWCRGLLPVDENRIWVGFTRVRKTKFQENIMWVKKAFHEGMGVKPTHISLYDIHAKRCLQEFDLEPHGMNIVFSIFPSEPDTERLHSSISSTIIPSTTVVERK
ncbi:MAG TPA: hypothetical protein VFA74_04120 [Terriglobales bacterium]|nr:hypothetical protein [Terriglobales bacterium]